MQQSAGIVVVVLVGTTLWACSSSQSAPGKQPSSWVRQGIANFRAASSVTVVPDADGEATCQEVLSLSSCAPFTLTQTSTTQNGAQCSSIPSCASVFFAPVVDYLGYSRFQWSGAVEISGDTRQVCSGWCAWDMTIDRATGEIIGVDIYVHGGSHVGWPTYSFYNYVVGGKTLNQPRPQPVSSSGSLTLTISGSTRIDYDSSRGSCSSQQVGALFDLTDPAALHASTPHLETFDLRFEDEPSDKSQLYLKLYPGHEYLGQIETRAVNGDPWRRSMTGSIPSENPDHQDSINITAEINCG
jgi:hypothetical protein